MLSGLPAVGLQMFAVKMGLDSEANIGYLLFYVFIVVALSEELVKLFMTMIYPL